MSNGELAWVANYIWGIADDVLRDLYVRGKYRDVILPMTVLRRLDAVLEETKQEVAEYEPDPDLRDLEQIPLQESGGIDGFLQREVLPYAADAWYQPASVKIGYEISFTRYFYRPPPMRTLDEIRADILAVEQESQDLLADLLGPGAAGEG